MVSEKLIVVLIIIAILLSVISIAVTLSSVNTKMIPEIKLNEESTEDVGSGRVGITISRWVAPNSSNE